MMDRWQMPRRLPLYGALLAAATLSPFWTLCGPRALSCEFSARDFTHNVAIFLPFGIALRRIPAPTLALLTLGLAGAIDVAQMHLPRTPA